MAKTTQRRFSDLRRTARLFRRYKGDSKVYLWGVVLLVFEAATAVIEPYPIAYLIDFLQGARPSLRELGWPTLVSSERIETLLLLTVAIIMIAAINSAADSMVEVCMARGGRSLGYRVRVAMYSHLQRLSLAYHDKKRTGDVLTRVTGDVLVFEDFVVKSVSNILGSLLVLLGSFALLLYQSWSIAMIALLVVPLLGFVSNYFSRRIKAASKAQRTSEGELASTAQEMLTSIRLVQSYGRGKVDLDRFADQTGMSMHASLGVANIQATFSFVIALVEAAAISAVVWMGVWLVDREAITIGTLVLFVLLLQNMFKPARKIVSEWYKVGKVFASVERIDDLLDRDVVVRDLPGAVSAPPLAGRLTFRNVSFTYPAEHEDGSAAAARPRVLNGIDFTASPGEVVALVGTSGAGKSTVAQLVPRLYDPDEGAVLVDDVDVRTYTLSSLRSQVSLVLQDTVLLCGTVAENIAYGIADATQERIEAAARMANAHDFISAMPDGYETLLAERGATLSGGQRQRIAIARAFIRETPILILDEPTTGLDLESTQLVREALRNLMRGKTTIVISHDVGLIDCADRVLLMSQGRIVESGPDTASMPSVHRDGDDALPEPPAPVDMPRVQPMKAPSPTQLSGALSPAHTSAGLNGATVAARPAPDGRDGSLAGGATTRPPGIRAQHPVTIGLSADVQDRLPGLGMALDERYIASQAELLLMDEGAQVRNARAGSFWWREDGSLSLRWRLDISRAGGGLSTCTVLGRVSPDRETALRHLDDDVLPVVPPTPPQDPTWRTWAAVDEAAALTMYPFPVDPALPTLAPALDPARVAGLLGWERPPARVEVVRYARDRTCVLRYRVDDGHGEPELGVYGKVYSRLQARAGEQALRSLRELSRRLDPRTVPIPQPIVYDDTAGLLLTRPLPGSPLPPRLAAAFTSDGAVHPRHAAVPLVADCGRMLASLHHAELPSAPVYEVAAELDHVRRELDLVASMWPWQARMVGYHLQELANDANAAPRLTLCHGDFTPSQVLVDGTEVVGLVDLDTVCWSDPARDLGRFVAHADLLAAKTGGQAAEQRALEVTSALLGAYRELRSAPGTVDRDLVRRVAFFRGLSLVRSALRACRQLKDERLAIALSLMEPARDWARKVDA